MKFTVKDKTTTELTVEYEDGTYAVLPLNKGMDLEQIKLHADSFNHQQVPFDSVDDIPVTVGAEYEVVEPDLDPQVDYKVARRENYPEIGNQLDALYWARQGDDTRSKAIDDVIQLVKDKIPKNSTTYKMSEVDKLLD